jgi:transposase-like protein
MYRPEITLQLFIKISDMKSSKFTIPSTKPTSQGYSYGFKVHIVEQVEQEQISINQASKLYEVSRGAVHKWVKKYGNLDKKLKELGGKSPKQEIADLKKKLEEAEIRAAIWESAVELLEEDLGINAKKKYLNDYQKEQLKKQTKK